MIGMVERERGTGEEFIERQADCARIPDHCSRQNDALQIIGRQSGMYKIVEYESLLRHQQFAAATDASRPMIPPTHQAKSTVYLSIDCQ
eukprot:scaffold5351_cov199-Alexandrium_tamarense.AAC.21